MLIFPESSKVTSMKTIFIKLQYERACENNTLLNYNYKSSTMQMGLASESPYWLKASLNLEGI